MSSGPSPLHQEAAPCGSASSLGENIETNSAAIQGRFETTGDGGTVLRERSRLVDEVVTQLYRQLISEDAGGPQGLAVVAVGGYGRRELFPHSDVDLVFLVKNGRHSEQTPAGPFRDAIATLARTLWDLRFRVGHSVRTLAECGQLQRDNLELSVSLLDGRCLCGDQQLFAILREKVIPQLVARDRRDLVSDLVEMTRQRHQKQGDTIFHLEPNFKDVPGGLRDYHVCRWLARFNDLDRSSKWNDPESQFPPALREGSRRAFEFLTAVRCFVHYRQGRDDNVLSYELQDQAAAHRIGWLASGSSPATAPLAAEDWMRSYFRHTRVIDRLSSQLVESVSSGPSSLYALFQDWRSRLSNADFSVIRGRIFPRVPAAAIRDGVLLLSLFEMMARHGLELSSEGEHWLDDVLGRVRDSLPGSEGLWARFRRILVLPHAPAALRAMHRTGVLVALFPEFRAIDALVIRDFYHRYTVDEHSLMTIQSLHQLAATKSGTPSSVEAVEPWDLRFAEILGELEQPELLYFALLFHDVGKGMPVEDHTQGSLEALETVFARLQLSARDREVITFLVARHLDMSATFQRRDIFDPDTIREVAERVGMPERLKMLTLLTFADIAAVNPEALTPWKKEMLWRLYASVSNQMVRNLDEERFHTGTAENYPDKTTLVLRILSEDPPSPEDLPYFGDSERNLGVFLDGFPKRYLGTHTPEEIATHYRMSRLLLKQAVQLHLHSRKNLHELTILTPDRPFLFASLTGALAAWGMNILKVAAFANRAGLVLDTFKFVDLYDTLQLNAGEVERLKKDILEVLDGGVKVSSLIERRGRKQKIRNAKVEIPTQVHFDDVSSSHSTLMELVTHDRLGLLYQVSSTFAELGCNIEVALIDTEGEKAIDVFYLTSGDVKLDAAEQENIRERLLTVL